MKYEVKKMKERKWFKNLRYGLALVSLLIGIGFLAISKEFEEAFALGAICLLFVIFILPDPSGEKKNVKKRSLIAIQEESKDEKQDRDARDKFFWPIVLFTLFLIMISMAMVYKEASSAKLISNESIENESIENESIRNASISEGKIGVRGNQELDKKISRNNPSALLFSLN